jgi:hypothetical protein
MKILIINDNKAVSIDGQTIENLEFILSDDIHCINFDTETKKGEIEYKNDFNKTIDSFDYKPFKDLFDLELKKINPPNNYSKFDDVSKSWIEDIELLRASKLNDIKNIYEIEANKNVSFEGVLYKGGESSAKLIQGAVDLAKALGEMNTKIIDAHDNKNFLSFEKAMELSTQISFQWRGSFFKYKELKIAIKNENNIEKLKLITWRGQ